MAVERGAARVRAKREARPAGVRGAKLEALRKHAAVVAKGLEEMIPDAKCELDFQSPFQLLVATILSAQTTDKGVNRVTPELFRRFPTPRALADAPQEAVETIIKSTGFFRQKAKNIRSAARAIADEHSGEVPRTMEELIRLPGVARKTANVVLGTAYGISSGITVDTHVTRVSRRLALTRSDDPVRIEQDLMALFPRPDWPSLGHRMVLHGRYTCLARGPRCTACRLLAICAAPEAKATRKLRQS
jgi:endonuclease-3